MGASISTLFNSVANLGGVISAADHPTHLDQLPIENPVHGSTTQSNIPAQDNVSGLFSLPPEIRLMIWKLLLPRPRIMKARTTRFTHKIDNDLHPTYLEHSGQAVKVFCRLDHYFALRKQPILLQICRESRAFLLQRGVQLFGLKNDPCFNGIWWDPDNDVLLFDNDWSLEYDWTALDELEGLENIRNIALDADQARYMSWRLYYKPDMGPAAFAGQDADCHAPEAIQMFFLPVHKEFDHFLPKYFPNVHTLRIVFPGLCSKSKSSVLQRRGKFCNWGSLCHVTFHAGTTDRSIAIPKLVKYTRAVRKTEKRGLYSVPMVFHPQFCYPGWLDVEEHTKFTFFQPDGYSLDPKEQVAADDRVNTLHHNQFICDEDPLGRLDFEYES